MSRQDPYFLPPGVHGAPAPAWLRMSIKLGCVAAFESLEATRQLCLDRAALAPSEPQRQAWLGAAGCLLADQHELVEAFA